MIVTSARLHHKIEKRKKEKKRKPLVAMGAALNFQGRCNSLCHDAQLGDLQTTNFVLGVGWDLGQAPFGSTK
jgi:hypothetical protein